MRWERRLTGSLLVAALLAAGCGNGGAEVESSATSPPPISSTGVPEPEPPSSEPPPTDPAAPSPTAPAPNQPAPQPGPIGPAEPVPPPGEGATLLPMGEPVAVGSATVTFLELLEDSRCPADVMCVWEGELKVLVAWEEGGQVDELELTWAYHADPTTVPDGTASLALDDVAMRDGVLTAEVRVLPT